MHALHRLNEEIVACERCPRLRQHCVSQAAEPPRRFRGQDYWARPVPGFGDPGARLLLVGLAPAAHGANRTGRMFTGDDSGNWLYEALHRFGFASQPGSSHRGDGLVLTDAYITAAARCAPPDNKPAAEELENCRPFLARELALLSRVRLVIALGRVGFEAYLKATGRRRLPFGHGLLHDLEPGAPRLLCSYHPSRQNTNTGKLTREMWHSIFRRARELLES